MSTLDNCLCRPAWLVLAVWGLLAPGAAVSQVLSVDGPIGVDRGFGKGELRSDVQARHGDVTGLAPVPGEAVYIESFHQAGDSGGLVLGGDAAALWSPADPGNLIFFVEEDSTVAVAQIAADGTYTKLSDLRVKREVRSVSSDDFLDRVLQLEAKRYRFAYTQEDYVKGGAYLERDHIGLIAQDVETVFPEAVTEDPATGLKYVAHHQLIAVLLESVKALNSRIEALEAARRPTSNLAPLDPQAPAPGVD